MKAGSAYAIGVALVLLPLPASSAANRTTPLFSISKSENRNYVQFAVRLDASCTPSGEAPVFAYWRMLERGPERVEPLLAHEQPAYGIAAQSVVTRSDGHGEVRFTLRALSSMPLVVKSWRTPGGVCAASVHTSIAGVSARLFNVHAVLRWPFGVARLLVSGWSLADGLPVRDARSP